MSMDCFYEVDSVAFEYAGGSFILLPKAFFIISLLFLISLSLVFRWLKYFFGLETKFDGEINTKFRLEPT